MRRPALLFALFAVTLAAPALAAQGDPRMGPLPVFEFHSGFWVNLHHFLYQQARERRDPGASKAAPAALPGFTADMRWASLAFLAVGIGILIVATVKNGSSRPRTALTLLIASNASFWLSYGLWLIRSKFLGPSPEAGIDPFAGSVAFWLILLLMSLLYEAVVFLRGLAINQERTTAVVGLLASAVQVLVTLRTIYGLVEGV